MKGSHPTERVVDVVEILADDPAGVFSLSEIAHLTEQALPTCHAITTTLVERGWLVRSPTNKGFSIGPKVLGLVRREALGYVVAHAARPELAALAERFSMRASSAVVEGDTLTLVEAAGSSRAAKLIGLSIPFAPPFGSVFVAWADDDTQQAWLDRTPGLDERQVDTIRVSLAETRKRGYAVEWLTERAIRMREILSELPDEGLTTSLRAKMLTLFADLCLSDYLNPSIRQSRDLPVSIISAPVLDDQGKATIDVAVEPGRVMRARQIAAVGKELVRVAERVRGTLADSTEDGHGALSGSDLRSVRE